MNPNIWVPTEQTYPGMYARDSFPEIRKRASEDTGTDYRDEGEPMPTGVWTNTVRMSGALSQPDPFFAPADPFKRRSNGAKGKMTDVLHYFNKQWHVEKVPTNVSEPELMVVCMGCNLCGRQVNSERRCGGVDQESRTNPAASERRPRAAKRVAVQPGEIRRAWERAGIQGQQRQSSRYTDVFRSSRLPQLFASYEERSLKAYEHATPLSNAAVAAVRLWGNK